MIALRVARAAVIGIGISACASVVTGLTEFGQIDVLVESVSGEAVARAKVTLFSGERILDSDRTDERGRHAFEFVPPGEYGVVATMPPTVGKGVNGPSFQDGIRVQEGDERHVSFVVEPCLGKIDVRVEDMAGVSVQGADLVLYTVSEIVARGTTAGDGRFTFENAGCGFSFGVGVEPPAGLTVEPGRGSSFFDGLVIEEDGGRSAVTFVLTDG